MKTLPSHREHVLSQEVDPAFAQRAHAILQYIEDRKPKKVLDAGCGRGFYTAMLSKYSFIKEIHGVDISNEYLTQAQKTAGKSSKVFLKQGSIYDLPFPNNHFDTVICSEIFEHLDKDVKAMKEIHRVLKPGGILLASVPHQNFPFLWDPLNWILMKVLKTHVPKHIWWLAGIWADHERLYTSDELRKKIKKAGYTVVEEKKIVKWAWPFSHFILYGIGKNIVDQMGAQSFNRFNISEDKPIARRIATFMALPSRLFDRFTPSEKSMGLFIAAEK